MEQQPNRYDEILNNFEQFCDEFEFAASKRFSGIDNESEPLQGVSNFADSEHDTPRVVREVEVIGREDIISGEPPVDVPSTEI